VIPFRALWLLRRSVSDAGRDLRETAGRDGPAIFRTTATLHLGAAAVVRTVSTERSEPSTELSFIGDPTAEADIAIGADGQ
jgi:hypothetical protein